MKKIIAIFVTVIMIFCLCSCDSMTSKIKQANFNVPTKINNFELNVSNNLIIATQLNGDEDQFDEFLTTDLTNYGETVPCDVTIVAKEGNTMFVVSYSIKNNGKSNKEFDEKIILNYNNGYEYEAKELYWSTGGIDDWHKFTSIEIEPLSSIMCKALFMIPQEIFDDTNVPIKLTIANQEYTIQ